MPPQLKKGVGHLPPNQSAKVICPPPSHQHTVNEHFKLDLQLAYQTKCTLTTIHN